jgi:hypothetical protein
MIACRCGLVVPLPDYYEHDSVACLLRYITVLEERIERGRASLVQAREALAREGDRADAAALPLAQAQRERDESQKEAGKWKTDADRLFQERNHIMIEAGLTLGRVGEQLAQARAALESTREALFSYRSLAYGYAPMKTLEEYDDKHERALLPPPDQEPGQ